MEINISEFRTVLLNFMKSLLKRSKDIDISNDDQHAEFLLNNTRSEEERSTLQEVFYDIDVYHSLMNDMMQSGQKPEEWFDEKIESDVKELVHEVTPDDIDKVKEAICDAMEKDIDTAATQLEEEYIAIEKELDEEANMEQDKSDKGKGGEQ